MRRLTVYWDDKVLEDPSIRRLLIDSMEYLSRAWALAFRSFPGEPVFSLDRSEAPSPPVPRWSPSATPTSGSQDCDPPFSPS